MKKSSRRALSRLLASVMLVSSVIGTTFVNASQQPLAAYGNDAVTTCSAIDAIASGSAVAGETYSADFAAAFTACNGDTNKFAGLSAADGTIAVASPDAKAYLHDKQHGLIIYNGDRLAVNVAGDAKITLSLCQYGGGTEFAITDAEGNSLGSVAAIAATDGETVSYEYTGKATTLTFTLSATKEAYLHSVTSVNAADTTGVAEAGKTYSIDFAATYPGENLKVGGMSFADGTITVSSPSNKAFYHGAEHGLAIADGDAFSVNVAGNAEITFTICTYSKTDSVYVITNSAGEKLGEIAAKSAADAENVTFNYTGDADTLTFTYSGAGTGYLHAITSVNAAAPVGVAVNFELWLDDIAQDVETVNEAGETVITKTIDQKVLSYEDSTLALVGNTDKKFTPEIEAGRNCDFGVRVANAYKAGPRHATANDITAIPVSGDGTAGTSIVFTPAATGTFNTYFYSGSFLRVWDFDAKTGARNGYVDSDTGLTSYAFKAQAGHTYVISTTGKTNNCAYAGFEYIVDEPTTVAFTYNNIDANASSIPSLEVYLTDAALGTVEGTVKSTTTEPLPLALNHTYKLSTNDGGVRALVNGKDSFKADVETVTIDLYDIPDQTLTGEITGTEAGTVTKLTFTNKINGVAYDATITGSTYSCVMKPGDYNTSVETTNGGVTYDHVKVVQDAENVNEVWVELPDPNHHDLPTEWGTAWNMGSGIAPEDISELKLTVAEGNKSKYNNPTSIALYAGDTITVPVSGKQKVTVAGWYAGAWDINGQEAVAIVPGQHGGASDPLTSTYTTNGTETSVTVTALPYIDKNGAEVAGPTYLYWIQLEDVVEFKPVINVPGDYDTLNEADEAICAMVRPEGEAGRVTINMTANLEEQVTFDAPYVTLNGNDHVLTWYYGVGTNYYSIDKSTGLYSERLFRDKYSYAEGDGTLWGGVAIVRGNNFIAEYTTFKNTYNYYVTDKEAVDVAGTINLPARTKDADVSKRASTERSNAFYIAADNIEVYNCNILSSQDTLGRNGSANNNYHTYFKNCVIGGNVDYICGEFTAIFDNCQLRWKTYANDASNNGKVGYITAPKTSPYIFRNCIVTTDGVGTDVQGLYGRTWGANSNCYFIDTETNGYIKLDGWGQMNTSDSNPTFYEYGNTSTGEDFVTTGGAIKGIMLKDAEAEKIMSDDVITTYLAGWTPVHYSLEEKWVGKWGDADQSGILTANDAAATLAYVLDKRVADSGMYDFRACDVNADGCVGSDDAADILTKVLDGRFTFKAEPTTEATTEMPIDESPNYIAQEHPAGSVLSDGATQGVYAKTVVYNGVDASIMTMQDMKYASNDGNSEITIGDNKYVNYYCSTSVNTPMTVDGTYKEKGYRVAYAITAKNDVTVSLDIKLGPGRTIALTTGEVGENKIVDTVNKDGGVSNAGSDAIYTTVTQGINAGETLYVIGVGTDVPIYAVRFVAGVDKPAAADCKVYVVGDSTACHYGPSEDKALYIKRVGYGDGFSNYFDSTVEVVNLALSGRSSKSFTEEENYQTLLSSMTEGDYLLIGFGHNDEKSDDAARYTSPGGTKETEGSFKNSVYVNYIQPALAAGATPILVTPIVRRTDSGTWSDSQLHKANGGDYKQDMIDLGAELGLTVVDATTLTKNLYDELTPANSAKLHSWSTNKETSVDNTHLNSYGAKYVAYLIAEDIKASSSTLASRVLDGNVPPTEADIVYNADYVPTSDVDPEDLTSKLWTTTAPWYGTVFGDCGGNDKINPSYTVVDENGEPVLDENGQQITEYDTSTLATHPASGQTYFNVSENADGTVNVRSGIFKEGKAISTQGKIASTSDSFAMYYMPVTSANFEIKGTITVNDVASNNQVSFGAIISDTVLIDKYEKSMFSYVAAGPIRLANIGGTDKTTGEPTYGNSTFARIDGVLNYGPTLDVAPQVGDKIDVSIKKIGDNFTVTYGDATQTYTLPMKGTVYAGFYATRAADITVSDISYNNEVVE